MTIPDWLPATIEESIAYYADALSGAQTAGQLHEVKRLLCRGDLFYLMAYQLNRPDVVHPWIFDRCREVQARPDGYLDLWSRDSYKDLANDTPMLTANRGWTTHGDLLPGDYVFSPDGVPVEVLWVSEQYTDSECYEISFVKSQANIVCGAGHLWRLRKKIKNRIPGTNKRIVRFEDQIFETWELIRKNGRLDIGCAEPLQYPEESLPVDPYILGCWLGDGHTNAARFTCAKTDWPHFEKRFLEAGHTLRIYEKRDNCLMVAIDSYDNSRFCVRGHDKKDVGTYYHQCNVCRKMRQDNKSLPPQTVNGMSQRLRRMGLLKDLNKKNAGNFKHIPRQYLEASVEQRMELLRGLMDTDGHCGVNGSATFCQKKERLSRDVYELAAGLGLKPNFRKVNGKYKGEAYPYFHVSFAAHEDRNPFALKRKANRALPPSYYRGVRIIDKIKRVPSVPTRCISVRGEMYLAGNELLPTHNSSLLTFGLTIKDILNDPEDTICLFSHTKGNAKKFLRQIKREFEINRGLQELFPDVLYAEPDKQSPLWSEDSGLVVRRTGNPKEPTLKASGLVDGQQTGDHFKKRIYDDTVTQDSVTTPEQIAKTTEGWEMSISLGTRDGIERYIGTRYSLHDTYAEMMKRGAVKPRLYPATHNGRMDGSPVFFTEEVWEQKLKKLSRFNIASQYLQNPLADEDATFSSLWLHAWEVRPRTVNIYILGDPNRKIGADNDNCAFIVIAVSAMGGKYLVDGYRHQMTQSQRWTALRDLYKRWSAEKGVQSIYVGYEKYGAEQDLDYFEERQQKEDVIFPIEQLSWTREGTSGQQGKRYRVERLEPDFRNGRFHLPLAVLHEGRPCTWRVDSEPLSKTFREIIWTPLEGFTKQQLVALNGGSEDLICKAIKRVDENGRVYDVTDKFIEEYLNFPFGEYKDAIDAASRLYDMEPIAPNVSDTREGEPPQFHDS